MVDGHFVSRSTWRSRPGKPKGKARRKRNLEEAYFGFTKELDTNQKYVCHNCHYADFVSDETAYYYLVFGDFHNHEPSGFECPNCGGPMVGASA